MSLNDVFENRLLSQWARFLPRQSPAQIGGLHESDCELVSLGDGRVLALTVDAVDEEIATGLYPDAATAARMAVVATLSDLAAVGATPLGLLVSACLPETNAAEVLASVASGIAAATEASGTFVLGGDTSEGAALRIACTGAGLVPSSSVLRRIGLKPGDRLFASGPLGAGAALAAVRLLGLPSSEVGIDPATFHPAPRIRHGMSLRVVASACIDTSDGLVAAVDQLARLNDVAIDLEADLSAILAPSARAVCSLTGVSPLTLLATPHGEFELVFGVPRARIDDLARIATRLDWHPIPLGQVSEGRGLTVRGRSIDGAKLRNAFREANGDLVSYIRDLESLTKATS